MGRRTICLAGFTAMFCVSAAYASDCEVRPSNLDAFAKYRLGQPLRALPSGVKRLPHCAVYVKHHDFDCEFVDADGTHYLAADRQITKLERGPEMSAALPPSFPLKFGMPFEEARGILSSLDPKIEFTASHSDEGYGIDTGECLKDSHGVTYYFVVDFDKAGRLNKLTAAFVTAED
jgi:hypothetical protein